MGSSRRVIDVHTHAISPAIPHLEGEHPYGSWPAVQLGPGAHAQILVGGRHFRTIDSRCWSVPRRLDDMDREEVALQVVSPVPVTFCYGAPVDGARALCRFQNDFLGSLCAEEPRRFAALGTVPLQDPDAALEELEYCMALGFLGIEVGSNVAGVDLADSSNEQVLAAAADLGALVFVHPVEGREGERLAPRSVQFGIGLPCETAVAAAKLLVSGVFGRWPNLRVCLAHAGGALPAVLPRLQRGWEIFGEESADSDAPLAAASRLMCDSLAYDEVSLAMAISRFGPSRVMVGSDYPFAARESPPGASLRRIGFFGEEEMQLIRSGNAAALLTGRDAERWSSSQAGTLPETVEGPALRDVERHG